MQTTQHIQGLQARASALESDFKASALNLEQWKRTDNADAMLRAEDVVVGFVEAFDKL